MNALAPPSPVMKPETGKPRVAVLVDGENLSQDHAGKIILRAGKLGRLTVARVYGDAAKLPKWATAPRFRLIHSQSGKNSADMHLTIDAMHLALTGQAETFVIASSDSDFTPLALYLREAGFTVWGLGEAKARESFRAACAGFEVLALEKGPIAPSDPTVTKIAELIRAEGKAGAMAIPLVSTRMHKLHGIKISTLPQKTWRAYLLAHPDHFVCDPRGPDAQVRLRA